MGDTMNEDCHSRVDFSAISTLRLIQIYVTFFQNQNVAERLFY